jgi:hypothetical protein
MMHKLPSILSTFLHTKRKVHGGSYLYTDKKCDLNHSGKFTNGFGKNNRPLFPSKGKGRGVETRNWISTFKVAGCIGCKDGGESVHKGRSGQPVVLVVGDEAVPTTVGVTKKDAEGDVRAC